MTTEKSCMTCLGLRECEKPGKLCKKYRRRLVEYQCRVCNKTFPYALLAKGTIDKKDTGICTGCIQQRWKKSATLQLPKGMSVPTLDHYTYGINAMRHQRGKAKNDGISK
jgi:hypothetical protein